MPTINEVWEQALQINANLAVLHNDQIDLKNCCNLNVQRGTETNAWLDEIRTLIAGGFSAMAAGFAAVHDRQDIANQLLLYHAQQHQTMICLLEQIASNTCALLNESAVQTRQQKGIASATHSLDYMFATVHPEGALALERDEERRKELERCCPPEEPPAPCKLEECRKPGQIDLSRPREFDGFTPPPSRVRNRDR